jgi:hypothetical protein
MDTSIIPANFTDAAGISVILAFFVPLVMNFVNKATWPSWVKALLTFLVSAIVGTIVAFYAGAYEGLGIPSIVILTFVVAIAAYKMGWQNWFPNMQRGSAEKAELEARANVVQIQEVAAPVVEQKLNELPAAVAQGPVDVPVTEWPTDDEAQG